jgi:hypothetical protein
MAAVKLARMKNALFAALTVLTLGVAAPALAQPVNPGAEAKPAKPGEWRSLFNGRDLSGWTVKINKHPLGENFADTFRVEDGVIKVSYDRYGKFDEQFGHLYSNQAYGSYVLQLEYRITGTAVADSPPWAKLNSGVMIHSQSPMTMGLNQAWPASM